MALPSQMERSTSNRPVTTRAASGARGSLRKPAVVALGLLVAAGALYGVYTLLPRGTTSPDAAKANPVSVTPPKTDVKVAAATPAPAKPVEVIPPPVTIQQGSKGAVTNPNPSPSAGGNVPGAGPDPTKPAPVDVNRPDLRPTPPAPAGGAGGTTPGTPQQPLNPSNSTMQVRTLIETADRAAAGGRLVEARATYSAALLHPDAGPTDQAEVREKVTKINEDLVFSGKVTPGDPLSESYQVASGDSLERITRKRDLSTDWRLIQRINGIANPNALRVGQKLKLLRGPFHAVVHKSDFRLDLFAGSPDEPERWVYVRSFKVGLGAGGGTPLGTFIIKKNSKLLNPHWTNPKTGEKFDKDDPKNPIGEHWLGWEGVGDAKVYTGFGLHGTIEPESIGQEKSMGCVRMLPNDIALVWEMLGEQVSIVKVVP